jgi:hypothetical protein
MIAEVRPSEFVDIMVSRRQLCDATSLFVELEMHSD